MTRARFQFALRQLRAADWERFEHLAASFLASEFPDLRTTANPAGDQGRDGTLFSPAADDSVVFQYSITASWEDKIKRTVKRLAENFPNTAVLVYVTNQEIGSKADKINEELRRTHKIFLDVRDQSWFLERLGKNQATQAAAEELAESIVDPILASDGLVANKALALTEIEARSALLFLELQWEDDTREKGLTKLSYEALVISALRDTDASKRMSRADVHRRVGAVVPNHSDNVVKRYTDSALNRLAKKSIRHWQKSDEFCLSFEETNRIRNRLAEIQSNDHELRNEIAEIISRLVPPDWSIEMVTDFVDRTRRVLDVLFLELGEEFAAAAHTGIYKPVQSDELHTVVFNDVSKHPYSGGKSQGEVVGLVEEVVLTVLHAPGVAMRQHLRALADSYTLLAFLRETPDVQAVIGKMFSVGDLWLDTSLVLPLFAELLLEEEERQYANIIEAAVSAGMHLHVTSGVVEEIAAHIIRSTRFMQDDGRVWERIPPYLASKYINTGRSPGSFYQWTEQFMGDRRQHDDIAAYLQGVFSINRVDLQDEAASAPDELHFEVENVWQTIHDQRRQKAGNRMESLMSTRLAKHDIENYLGILQRRPGERDSPLGFNSWRVTLDSAAHAVDRRLRVRS